MSTRNPNTPVIAGVGQFLNRIESLEQALEPLEMMLEAVRRAEADAGVGDVLRRAQSVRVVRGMWNYRNPAAAIAERIGAVGAQTVGTLIGGNQNQALMNHTALEILAGKVDLVLIAGAENGYSSGKARRTGKTLPESEASGAPDVVFGAEQQPEHHPYERAKGISRAIQVYPDVRQTPFATPAARRWTSISRGCRRCGRASTTWRKAIRTPGCGAP